VNERHPKLIVKELHKGEKKNLNISNQTWEFC
jgi:hypothetical protein